MVWDCFSGAGLGPLVPVKRTLNASAYQAMLDNSILPILWEQFGDVPFQHDQASKIHKDIERESVWINLTGLHRVLTSTQ